MIDPVTRLNAPRCTLTRREFLERAARQSVGARLAAVGLLAACRSTEDEPSPLDLSAADTERLILLIDEIIPSERDMPAASEAGTLAYFELLAQELPELRGTVRESLEAVESTAEEEVGRPFEALSTEDRHAVVRAFEAAAPALFDELRVRVFEGYYLQPRVWSLMGYAPHPTGEAGPSMEPFDPTLLDRVRRMPPLFKEA